ncbi:hypothetical protein Patl1_09770 [Pistacia atlantica]|uniref:Uncharacterized protein n=1 Tax=Pistacia atlantica TaxID=434234 RepID=A0ACC1A5U9_9ROSI|nr:hypothetical protein Patl1_09770 [Pistacia atlantica]
MVLDFNSEVLNALWVTQVRANINQQTCGLKLVFRVTEVGADDGVTENGEFFGGNPVLHLRVAESAMSAAMPGARLRISVLEIRGKSKKSCCGYFTFCQSRLAPGTTIEG